MESPFKMTQGNIFFLLGGYDLEMVEIRRLLESCNLQEGRDFADLRLGWGAKLSAYAAVLEDPQFSNRVFAGIELGEDITPPDGYLRIDHHNELSHLPAAIVQLADLLEVTIDRLKVAIYGFYSRNGAYFLLALKRTIRTATLTSQPNRANSWHFSNLRINFVLQ